MAMLIRATEGLLSSEGTIPVEKDSHRRPASFPGGRFGRGFWRLRWLGVADGATTGAVPRGNSWRGRVPARRGDPGRTPEASTSSKLPRAKRLTRIGEFPDHSCDARRRTFG